MPRRLMSRGACAPGSCGGGLFFVVIYELFHNMNHIVHILICQGIV